MCSSDLQGEYSYKLAEELFPICRSITGNGVRKTLKIIQREIPELTISEVPSGTQVFDWTVPKEWNIKDAWVKDKNGKKIIDFAETNLHVMGYSTPVHKKVTLEELLTFTYTEPDQSDAIPYITSYYKERYGFCISENQKNQMLLDYAKDDEFEICIDSTLENGSLSYGEFVIPATEEFRGGVRMYSDIISAKEFLGDKKIFSTYASAQEVVQNQFQPSGFDYIIHVLGDEQRKKYLESFRKGDFDYAVTIREEHNDWENWIKRANWFFYRELYRNYSPVFENGYKRYWQKNESGQENAFDAKSGSISLKIEDINPSTKKIIISAPKYVSGTADVLIDYEIRKNKAARKSKFIFNMNLLVQETALNSKNTNSLRAKSKEYIPIEIKNGRGEAILSSKPVGSTMLEIKEVRCDEIFYIPKVILLSPITDKNWTKGILNSNKQTLLFAYDAKLLEKIQESDILQAQNEKFFIVKVENDSKWIRVTVDKDASACAYPANIAFSNQGIEFDIDSLFENAEDE